MFIVIGILSILAGCFVFLQYTLMYMISSLADMISIHFSFFAIVGISMIIAGAMAIASHDGKKIRFIVGATLSYIVTFIVAISHYKTGDMGIWMILSGILVLSYGAWLYRNSKLSKEETDTFIDVKMVNKDDVM